MSACSGRGRVHSAQRRFFLSTDTLSEFHCLPPSPIMSSFAGAWVLRALSCRRCRCGSSRNLMWQFSEREEVGSILRATRCVGITVSARRARVMVGGRVAPRTRRVACARRAAVRVRVQCACGLPNLVAAAFALVMG